MIRLKVAEVAAAKQMSRYRLEKLTGLDERTLRRIWRNPTETVITTETLDRLAVALDCDASELIESVRPSPEQPTQQA